MKRKILCAALLGLLLVVGAASGKVREFEYFTLDVPSGWKVARKDASVRVRKPDNSAVLIITMDALNGRSLKSIADDASKKCKGTKPERDEEGDYTFTCNGGKTESIVMEAGEFYLMMSATCEKEKDEEALLAILDSFELRAESFVGGDDGGYDGYDGYDGDGDEDDYTPPSSGYS